MAISDARTVWGKLIQAGAIRPDDYDRDVVQILIAELGQPEEEDLDEILKDLSAQQFIDALLRVIAPFSAMLTDLLHLYSEIGATTGDNDNLRVEYDFGDDQEEGLAFDLSQFAEWEMQTREALGRSSVVQWNQNPAWDLARVFRDASPTDGVSIVPPIRRDDWTQVPAAPPRCNQADASDAIGRTWSLLELFRRQAESLWPDRLDYRRGFIGGDPVQGELAVMTSDFWDVFLMQWLEDFSHRMNALELEGPLEAAREGQRVLIEVSRLLEELPVESVAVESQVVELLRVLSLPTWGKRHDIYAAWIFTLIVKAVPVLTNCIYVVQGRLAFGFSGSHLAGVQTSRGPMHIWAELRSPLKDPVGKGRSKSIQPDYSISLEPISAPQTSILAVECKQYKRSARKNPAEALADYTAGLPHARVILATYGPVSAKVADGLNPDALARVLVISHLRPGNMEQIDQFRAGVLEATPSVSGPLGGNSGDGASAQPIEVFWFVVEVEWSDPDVDLDIWAQIGGGLEDGVSYKNRSYADPRGEVWLTEDVTRGPGREILVIRGHLDVDVRLHLFRGKDIDRSSTVITVYSHNGTRRWAGSDLPRGKDPRLRLVVSIRDGVISSARSQRPAR